MIFYSFFASLYRIICKQYLHHFWPTLQLILALFVQHLLSHCWCAVLVHIEVVFMWLMHYFRPKIWIMIEQPASSWLFKLPSFGELRSRWSLSKTLTHMGIWGSDLMKATHLMSNMPTLKDVARTASRTAKKKHRERLARKSQRLRAAGKEPPVYYTQNSKGFHGGKDLQKSAVYPQRFVTKVFQCWLKQQTGVKSE